MASMHRRLPDVDGHAGEFRHHARHVGAAVGHRVNGSAERAGDLKVALPVVRERRVVSGKLETERSAGRGAGDRRLHGQSPSNALCSDVEEAST